MVGKRKQMRAPSLAKDCATAEGKGGRPGWGGSGGGKKPSGIPEEYGRVVIHPPDTPLFIVGVFFFFLFFVLSLPTFPAVFIFLLPSSHRLFALLFLKMNRRIYRVPRLSFSFVPG